MIDFREFEGAIREEVKRLDREDPNYHWSVTSIGKAKVRINWSYLDWGKERYPWEMTGGFDPETVEEGKVVVWVGPSGGRGYLFVGPNHWDDAKTAEDAVRFAVRGMGGYARRHY